MRFEEAEIVMTNDGDFYRGFTASTSPSARHFNVARAFRRLFPNELGTEKKIQMLRVHYEKLWIKQDESSDVQPPKPVTESSEHIVTLSGHVTGYGVCMSTPKLMETIHYVKGVDVRKLSDDQLIAIIREREIEIAKLNSTQKVPARLKKRATELQAELDAVVAFLDSLDSTPTT
jgi:hypothetical protein